MAEMKTKSIRIILVFVIFLAFVINFACEGEEGESPEPAVPALPALTDAIPYDQLGHGKLVFERIGPTENNYSGVYVIDIDRRMSWGIEAGAIDSPAVSPDGKKIAFTKHSDSNTLFDVHIMNIDGANAQNVSFIEGQDRTPSWTPDGSQILFWMDYIELTLYRQSPVPNPGDRILIKTFAKLWTLKGPVSASLFLKLAFVAHRPQENYKIHTMDIDGSNLRTITSEAPTDANYHSPKWSPDGQKIAYLLVFRDSNYDYIGLELIVMNSEGSNARSLAKFETNSTGLWAGQNDISLCWSPDGSKIAFNKKEEGHLISHIYIVNFDGSGLTQVTFAEGVTDRSVTWSN